MASKFGAKSRTAQLDSILELEQKGKGRKLVTQPKAKAGKTTTN